MNTSPSMAAVGLAHEKRRALFILFFVIGIAMASWVTRTPAIRDALQASTAQMGGILFGLSSGSMAGLLSSNRLIRRLGTKGAAIGGVSLLALGTVIIGLGAAMASGWLVGAGLFLFGYGMGASEIAVNVEGAEVEATLSRPVLAALHGCFSAGTLVGALLSILLTHANFPVNWHLWLVVLLAIPAIQRAARTLPAGNGKHDNKSTAAPRQAPPAQALWRDTRLLMIGIIIMAMALAEGAANDWLPLLMVDGHGFEPTSGSIIFAGFAAGMTVGRFAGSYFIARLGRSIVIFASTISCAIGLALAIYANHPHLAALSVLFWGMGASLGFPVAISAAGSSGPDPGRRVEMVAMAGYFSFLVGPPLLGFVGEHHGLRSALIIVLALVILAAFMAPAARTHKPEPSRKQ